MIEIRTIREKEAPDFLQLLCNVFELDYDRAGGIFFHEPMFDLRRKWALFEDGEMVSILTTVPLEFGWGRSIGIAGVATAVSRQRKGLAGLLLNRVLEESARQGEASAWLFAQDKKLYERCGFEVVDTVIRGSIRAELDDRLSDMLSFDEIKTIYEDWSLRSDARLRRDERRWKFWKWNLRVCTPFQGGYICHEGKQVRECVVPERRLPWRLPADSEWVGLKTMADSLGLPLADPQPELFFMGRHAPGVPEMFLTDQF